MHLSVLCHRQAKAWHTTEMSDMLQLVARSLTAALHLSVLCHRQAKACRTFASIYCAIHNYAGMYDRRLMWSQQFIALGARNKSSSSDVSGHIKRSSTHVQDAIDSENNRNQRWIDSNRN